MNPNATRNELIKADELWARAFAARDLSGLMTYFHEDAAVMTTARAVTSGKREIAAMMSTVFALPGFATRLRMTRAETAGSGDFGFTAGSYESSLKDAAGKPAAHSGHYLAVWKKGADRTWRIAIYSATPVASGARPEAAKKA